MHFVLLKKKVVFVVSNLGVTNWSFTWFVSLDIVPWLLVEGWPSSEDLDGQ